MPGNIYLIQDKDELVQMTESAYDSEELLQELLAKYPDLLAGDQMDTSDPRRWLLVSREVDVPAEEEGSGRWSADHLFLDQEGIPTLVEVKRSRDTRLRREVVGQMLDYAANAVAYWPADKIRQQFESRCEKENQSSDELLADLLGDNGEAERYWDQVATNLRAGRIRLVFVADVIPDELRRIVEFLNEQMNSAQVLAVEIKQYVGKGLRTLVPRVYGQTAEAEQAKSSGGRETSPWDEASFLEVFRSRDEARSLENATRILEWAKARSLRIAWGKGARRGSFSPMIDRNGTSYRTVIVWTGDSQGHIQVPLVDMRRSAPFDEGPKIRELIDRLNKIQGIEIPSGDTSKYPSFPLAALNHEGVVQFLDTLDWIVQQVKGG